MRVPRESARVHVGAPVATMTSDVNTSTRITVGAVDRRGTPVFTALRAVSPIAPFVQVQRSVPGFQQRFGRHPRIPVGAISFLLSPPPLHQRVPPAARAPGVIIFSPSSPFSSNARTRRIRKLKPLELAIRSVKLSPPRTSSFPHTERIYTYSTFEIKLGDRAREYRGRDKKNANCFSRFHHRYRTLTRPRKILVEDAAVSHCLI